MARAGAGRGLASKGARLASPIDPPRGSPELLPWHSKIRRDQAAERRAGRRRRVRALFCFESQISSSGIWASWSRVEGGRSSPVRAGKLVSSGIMSAPVFLSS